MRVRDAAKSSDTRIDMSCTGPKALENVMGI
jgi:hypothetical protein